MGKEISDKIIKKIQEYKNKGLNKNQTSEECNISWNTVDKYWGDEQTVYLEEKNKKMMLSTLSRDDYQRLYRYFDANISVADVIITTGIPQAREVYEEYCRDKMLPSPRNVVNYFVRCYSNYMEIKEKMKKLPDFEKRLDEIEKKVTRLYQHCNLDSGYNP